MLTKDPNHGRSERRTPRVQSDYLASTHLPDSDVAPKNLNIQPNSVPLVDPFQTPRWPRVAEEACAEDRREFGTWIRCGGNLTLFRRVAPLFGWVGVRKWSIRK